MNSKQILDNLPTLPSALPVPPGSIWRVPNFSFVIIHIIWILACSDSFAEYLDYAFFEHAAHETEWE